jgi:hypothetical protein
MFNLPLNKMEVSIIKSKKSKMQKMLKLRNRKNKRRIILQKKRIVKIKMKKRRMKVTPQAPAQTCFTSQFRATRMTLTTMLKME